MFSNKLVAQLNTRSFNFFVPYTPLKHNYRVFISPFLEYGAQKFVSRRTNRTFYSARSIRMAREVGRKRINIRSFRRNRNKPIPLIFAFSRLMCQKFSLSLSLDMHRLITFDRSVFLLYPRGSFRAISKSWTVILERNARQTWRAMHFYFHHFPLRQLGVPFLRRERLWIYRTEFFSLFFFFPLFCFPK